MKCGSIYEHLKIIVMNQNVNESLRISLHKWRIPSTKIQTLFRAEILILWVKLSCQFLLSRIHENMMKDTASLWRTPVDVFRNEDRIVRQRIRHIKQNWRKKYFNKTLPVMKRWIYIPRTGNETKYNWITLIGSTFSSLVPSLLQT